MFARQRESIFVGDTVLFLEEEVRGYALSPAPKLLDRSGRDPCQPGSRKASLSDGTTKQWLPFTMDKWRSILRTIRKGKVGHPAGKSLLSHILLRERECLFNVNSLPEPISKSQYQECLPCARPLTYAIISNPINTTPGKYYPNLIYEEPEAREVIITSSCLVNVEFKHKLV